MLSTHSHFTNALAASGYSVRALTVEENAPTGSDGPPTVELSAGHGIMSKSSPIAEAWIAGNVHRPVSWMAVSSLMNEPGSLQSVGAPSSSESLS